MQMEMCPFDRQDYIYLNYHFSSSRVMDFDFIERHYNTYLHV